MIDPDSFDPLAYVSATAPVVGLRLDADQIKKVADAFALVIKVARPALDANIPADAEPAPVFQP
jgi:hypothetical protein